MHLHKSISHAACIPSRVQRERTILRQSLDNLAHQHTSSLLIVPKRPIVYIYRISPTKTSIEILQLLFQHRYLILQCKSRSGIERRKPSDDVEVILGGDEVSISSVAYVFPRFLLNFFWC